MLPKALLQRHGNSPAEPVETGGLVSPQPSEARAAESLLNLGVEALLMIAPSTPADGLACPLPAPIHGGAIRTGLPGSQSRVPSRRDRSSRVWSLWATGVPVAGNCAAILLFCSGL